MFTNEFEVKCGGAKQTKANRMDELGRAVRSGNVDCMDELFELASSFAISIARRKVSRQEDAEDIAQEAMLQLFKDINKVDTISKWLNRVVSTKAANAFNKEKSPYKMCSLDAQLNNSTDDSLLLSEVIVDLQSSEFSEVYLTRYAVQQILALMPKRQQEVLYLRFIKLYEHDDIAGMLGISSSAVRGSFSKGQKNFRKEFSSRYDLNLFGLKSAYELGAA